MIEMGCYAVVKQDSYTWTLNSLAWIYCLNQVKVKKNKQMSWIAGQAATTENLCVEMEDIHRAEIWKDQKAKQENIFLRNIIYFIRRWKEQAYRDHHIQ